MMSCWACSWAAYLASTPSQQRLLLLDLRVERVLRGLNGVLRGLLVRVGGIGGRRQVRLSRRERRLRRDHGILGRLEPELGLVLRLGQVHQVRLGRGRLAGEPRGLRIHQRVDLRLGLGLRGRQFPQPLADRLLVQQKLGQRGLVGAQRVLQRQQLGGPGGLLPAELLLLALHGRQFRLLGGHRVLGGLQRLRGGQDGLLRGRHLARGVERAQLRLDEVLRRAAQPRQLGPHLVDDALREPAGLAHGRERVRDGRLAAQQRRNDPRLLQRAPIREGLEPLADDVEGRVEHAEVGMGESAQEGVQDAGAPLVDGGQRPLLGRGVPLQEVGNGPRHVADGTLQRPAGALGDAGRELLNEVLAPAECAARQLVDGVPDAREQAADGPGEVAPAEGLGKGDHAVQAALNAPSRGPQREGNERRDLLGELLDRRIGEGRHQVLHGGRQKVDDGGGERPLQVVPRLAEFFRGLGRASHAHRGTDHVPDADRDGGQEGVDLQQGRAEDADAGADTTQAAAAGHAGGGGDHAHLAKAAGNVAQKSEHALAEAAQPAIGGLRLFAGAGQALISLLEGALGAAGIAGQAEAALMSSAIGHLAVIY
jgi:hypothetical protein